MKKTYLEPDVFVFIPDVKADVLTLSETGSGDGMQIGWTEGGLK